MTWACWVVLSSITDAEGNQTLIGYETDSAYGKATSLTYVMGLCDADMQGEGDWPEDDPADTVIAFDYDENGNVNRLVDGVNNETTWTLDAEGGSAS